MTAVVIGVYAPTPLTVGSLVTVYWERGYKKYWTAELAESRLSLSKRKSTLKPKLNMEISDTPVGGDGIDFRSLSVSVSISKSNPCTPGRCITLEFTEK